MRSYLTYNTNGEISGVIVNQGAWPDGYDILSPNPTHPLAVNNRNAHAQTQGFSGFVAFDCNCEEEQEFCDCAAKASFNYYVVGGVLTEKAALTIKVDGNVVTPTSQPIQSEVPYVLPPGTDFVFSIESQVPDGTSITLTSNGARLSPSNPTLVFTNGVASCNLKAPPQSVVGRVWQSSINKYLRPFSLHVLGWE